MLYIFDLDDTLIYGHIRPSRPFGDVIPLPGRVDKIAELQKQGHTIGRQAKGEKQGSHKLTEKQVESLRAEYVPRKTSQMSLAVKYGISPIQVWRILHRKRWNNEQ